MCNLKMSSLLTITALASVLAMPVQLHADETLHAKETPHAAETSSVSATANVSNAKQAVDYYLAQVERIAKAMGQVTDEASADAATVTLDAAIQDINALLDSAEGRISEDDWAAEILGRQEELVQVQMQMSTAMMGIAQTNPALMQRIAEKLKDVPSL